MAGTTSYYRMAFFDFGEKISDPLNVQKEEDRFVFIDKQIFGLYKIFGNGVISGWDVFQTSNTTIADLDGLAVGVSEGFGIINGISTETFGTQLVTNLNTDGITYIYATLSGFSARDRSVTIEGLTTLSSSLNRLLLAVVTTDDGAITRIDNTAKSFISFEQAIVDEINQHKHRGTPPQVDLLLETKNQLPSARIGDLEASKITRGRIPVLNMPSLNHDFLANSGILTHSQLDTIALSLATNNDELLGEVSTTNLMKMILFLKDTQNYMDIDKFMNNEFAFVPGVSLTTDLDLSATTAIVDTEERIIRGSASLNEATYVFTREITVPTNATRLILTSNKEGDGIVTWGVNTNNSTDFEDYQVISENEVIDIETQNPSLRVAARLVGNRVDGAVDFPDTTNPYNLPLLVNTVDFEFENDTAFAENLNFRIRFYDDIGQDNLVHEANTLFAPNEGFSYDDGGGNQDYSVGGENIPAFTTWQILLDMSNEPSVLCDNTYYVSIEFSINGGVSWDTITDSEAFLKTCAETFEDFIDLVFENETTETKNYHFRIRYYSDNERTQLFKTDFSINDQSNWIINDNDNLGTSGVAIPAGDSVTVTFYPDLDDFNSGQKYYLSFEAWSVQDADFIYENNEYTFIKLLDTSRTSDLDHLAAIKNFSFMFALDDGTKIQVNSGS